MANRLLSQFLEAAIWLRVLLLSESRELTGILKISGDGKLQSSAAIPGSNLPTRFDGLEIFLVSSQTNVNITVSTGPGLLTQESGSTVKHLNWPIPTCISPGQYNVCTLF